MRIIYAEVGCRGNSHLHGMMQAEQRITLQGNRAFFAIPNHLNTCNIMVGLSHLLLHSAMWLFVFYAHFLDKTTGWVLMFWILTLVCLVVQQIFASKRAYR